MDKLTKLSDDEQTLCCHQRIHKPSDAGKRTMTPVSHMFRSLTTNKFGEDEGDKGREAHISKCVLSRN
jgi:hypothetical protein